MISTDVSRTDQVWEYLNDLEDELKTIKVTEIVKLIDYLQRVLDTKGKLFVLGNGGSCANASHLVLHMRQAGIDAVDLMADLPYLTALSNDIHYARAPAHRINNEGREGDALLVISGSGMSANVIGALSAAKGKGLTTCGLLGFGGGLAKYLCDVAVVLDSHSYGLVEDIHSVIGHILGQSITKCS